jgi:hypothetical protein
MSFEVHGVWEGVLVPETGAGITRLDRAGGGNGSLRLRQQRRRPTGVIPPLCLKFGKCMFGRGDFLSRLQEM